MHRRSNINLTKLKKNPFKEVNEEFSDLKFKVKGNQHSDIMSDVFSKIPIDFSKYRELLSDDNPKIPDNRIISDSFEQNQGDSIGSRPAGNLPRNETTEPSTMDKKKIENPQQSNKEPGVEDRVNMSPQVNQNRDDDVNRVNTYKEENEPIPWELSEDEHTSPTEIKNPDQVKAEEKEEEKVFVEEEDATPQETINLVFIEKKGETAVQELLSNCNRYKKELKLEDVTIESAVNDYKIIQKKAGETGCMISKNSPPCELNYVTAEEKREAPSLYKVISIVAKKCPNYRKWQDAVSEFITLTTYARPEPHQSKTKRSTSVSSSGYQPKRPKKEYRDNIHKLLDQEWEEDMLPRSGIDYDYRHLLTSQSVLRSEFPDANILDEVDIKVRGPDEVPFESRHRALYHFLSKIDMTKCGVDPAQAWNDYCRLTLAEKQLDLARRARGPDLDLNVILKKDKYNKLLKELKEKTEEIEELSTRFARQQLTEGNPNIADLSDTHRPTRLGEMYSQLFDDEWSEAFEAFKNKADGNEDDDDIFPDTLFILQNILTQIFQFCQVQSERQKVELGDRFAVAVELKTKSKLFIDDNLPFLIPEKVIREDARIVLYVQKCLELCWYMRMQDPPMVIVTPTNGQEVDKTLFSFHGRRGKTVEVCVWPALLLHENGPLVCKGYVLPEEKKRRK